MIIKLKKIQGGEHHEMCINGPVSLETLAEEVKDDLPYTVLLAKVNGRYEELNYVLEEDSEVEFLDIRDHSAEMAYQNSLSLIYIKAVIDIMGDVPVQIENSLNKGLYTEIAGEKTVTEEQLKKINSRMRDIVDKNIPIIREEYDRKRAVEIWEKCNCLEKARLLRDAEDVERAKFYSIEGYRNFFYGLMVPSTKYIKYFQLMLYGEGVLLRFPQPSAPDEIPPFVDDEKIYEAFRETKRWHSLMGVEYLPDLNDMIRNGGWKDLILLSEALHEKKIAEIADMITERRKRIILIAGPSSSGKTTFARRLCVQLRVNGIAPLYLGTDDYYLDRKDAPIGPDGQRNYENLESLDIELFNSDLTGLLKGEKVDLPRYDFITGEKVFGERITSISSNQPVVIEGIHGLNSRLTERISNEDKFRIYISPFTPLNIDIHNRVTTTDTRMIRRIVRDYEFRGSSAAETIALWPKVRAGEDRNIFPYNGQADVIFNSALVYELSVLKKYAVDILEKVETTVPEHAEAVRLLKFIRFFDDIEDEKVIPNNSIIREFIGGSIFVE